VVEPVLLNHQLKARLNMLTSLFGGHQAHPHPAPASPRRAAKGKDTIRRIDAFASELELPI
jgi:hypothetical protein